MKVILLTHIRRLGQLGDIVSVARGYGRNYLIPFGYAKIATKENKAQFELDKVNLAKKNDHDCKLALENVSKMEGNEYVFIVKAADDGHMFGSVTRREISRKIESTLGIVVKPADINISDVIKYVGIYEAKVSIHYGVDPANIIINVARSESEAKAAMEQHINGNTKTSEDTKATV